MRINLQVPYAKKDSAIAVGARWDVARKVWFIENIEDVMPPHLCVPHDRPIEKAAHRPVIVECADHSLPVCNCSSPPWEDCEHTLAEPALDGDEGDHIRSNFLA